jgi:hypothetical protein
VCSQLEASLRPPASPKTFSTEPGRSGGVPHPCRPESEPWERTIAVPARAAQTIAQTPRRSVVAPDQVVRRCLNSWLGVRACPKRSTALKIPSGQAKIAHTDLENHNDILRVLTSGRVEPFKPPGRNWRSATVLYGNYTPIRHAFARRQRKIAASAKLSGDPWGAQSFRES